VAEVEHAQELAQAEAEAEAERQRAQAEAAQAVTLAAQKAEELRQAEEKHARELAETAAALEAEKQAELERESKAQQAALDAKAAEESRQAEAEAAQQLAQREAELDARKQQELESEAREQAAELAAAKAALEAQKAAELGQAEAEHARQMAQAEAEAEAERQQALAEAEAERQQALAEAERKEQEALEQLQASLSKEKEDALAESEKEYAREIEEQKELRARAEEELSPFRKAAEAKEQIVDLLHENFNDYDESAVEIDDKTGKVRLNFQSSYFVRGSHELSQEMKDFLRIMIPKYARSIYENEKASELVESLKISGMTSPIYNGRYIDINDTSPHTERARMYNMDLSNRRAVAMYNFIFDEAEMGNYQYRAKLKKDMGIAALGYQEAQPVKQDLVGKEAFCVEYNCKKEQATILQFQLYTEELTSSEDTF
jgi:hypothetical protein